MKNPFHRFRRAFFTGLVVVIPVGVTAWVLWFIVRTVDGWLGPWISRTPWLKDHIPPAGGTALGVVAVLVGISVVGTLANSIFGNAVLSAFDRLMARIPLLKGIYSATKAALLAMAKAHALELGPHGVTVNCLAPGPVMTDLPMNLLNDAQKQTFAERTAVKRWGQVADMVGPALLLSSAAGAFVTGTMILADGGLLCRTFD